MLGRVLGIQFTFISLASAFGNTIILDIAAGPGWHFSYLFVTIMVLVAIALTFMVKDREVATEKATLLTLGK